MKYFHLRPESDPKIIGVNNGVYQGEVKWGKFKHKQSKNDICLYFSLEKYKQNIDHIEPINFELNYIEALKSAKMTDFFRFTPRLWGVDFLISDKVKSLFESFNLPIHTFIPAIIFHKDVRYDYWAFYIPVSYRENSINFKKSFFLENEGFQKYKKIKFNNIEEYMKYKYVEAGKITLNELFDKKLDLFTTMHDNGYYLSEKLKKTIEKNNLTGIKIIEMQNPEMSFD